ncbi:MAG: TonB-dependent receptor, partial [Pseudomonadota bacterium]
MIGRVKNGFLGACALAPLMVGGASVVTAQEAEEADAALDSILVTGSRIERSELSATSPLQTVGAEQINLDRSVTVEDIFQRIPQAAGGANATGATVGDSLGSSTIDLRGLGQNRTLVLVNGTRAVPFSFRNAVDTNSIPTSLIETVEVLTGGAAAVYGADAVAGVVNFRLKDDFQGLELAFTGEVPTEGGGESIRAEALFGEEIHGGRGHIVGAVEYTERFELLAGSRDFTDATVTAIPGEGGNFTDVASGNFFAFDENGAFTTDPQTVNVTPDRFLIQPLRRFNATLLFDYELTDGVEFYGRAMYTDVQVTGAGSTGQTPISVNEQVTITADNAFLPPEAASLLTFDANGEALVNVERNLGLGLQRTETSRDTFQIQGGFRGALTDAISWDVYAQYGRAEENAIVFNNAIRNDATGASRFGAIANTVDIFGPDADLSDFSTEIIHSDRVRDQLVTSAIISGDSSDVFELPAGPIGFAFGYEYRKENGRQTPGLALANGLAFGLGGVGDIDAGFDTHEGFGELLVPLVRDVPFIKELSVEGAYRRFDFSTTGVGDTNKAGLSWAVDDNLRFRFIRQSTVRAPNLGEFAGPEVQLSLSLFDPTSPDFIPRLGGRFDGDPCLDGRGDPGQCAAQGAAAPGTPFDTSQAIYSFGGNPNIDTEKGTTITAGFVLTPVALPGASLTVDYYDIEITDAVSQIQPIAALTDCYIDNPVPGNPLCGAVLRDPDTGLISQALVNDLNLASLEQEGFDIALILPISVPAAFADAVSLGYSATIVTEQSRQNNATVPALDCKGTFGSSCTGDFASILQADYKHRAVLNGALAPFTAQLSWRRIGGVVNANDPSDTI